MWKRNGTAVFPVNRNVVSSIVLVITIFNCYIDICTIMFIYVVIKLIRTVYDVETK